MSGMNFSREILRMTMSGNQRIWRNACSGIVLEEDHPDTICTVLPWFEAYVIIAV